MMVIAVDTGNRCIKTAHAEPFSAGLTRHFEAKPFIATDTLFYKGQYYTFSETQGTRREDKSIDDYYFMLTLAAIAREIVIKKALQNAAVGEKVSFAQAMKEANRAKKTYCEDVYLSVGLPPRDMVAGGGIIRGAKSMTARYKEYFLRDGEHLAFKYNDMSFDIHIKEVFVSAQGFAAIFPNDWYTQVTKFPQAYIIDIGGYTTDIALVANRRIDLNFFESLDFGVIFLYNEIADVVRKNHGKDIIGGYTTDIALVANRRIDLNFFESLDFGVIFLYNEIADVVRKNHGKDINGILIEAILKGENIGDDDVEETVKAVTDNYAKRLISSLRDRKIDMELSLPVLVGGGAQLMEQYLRRAIPRNEVLIVPDVRANAIGYEVFANRILKERQKSTF